MSMQEIETLINEETLLFAKYLRNERRDLFEEFRAFSVLWKLKSINTVSIEIFQVQPSH